MMDEKILKDAFQFHGHVCWASAAGVRAGKVAVPILIVATVLSPVGAYVSKGLNREVLLWLSINPAN